MLSPAGLLAGVLLEAAENAGEVEAGAGDALLLLALVQGEAGRGDGRFG